MNQMQPTDIIAAIQNPLACRLYFSRYVEAFSDTQRKPHIEASDAAIAEAEKTLSASGLWNGQNVVPVRLTLRHITVGPALIGTLGLREERVAIDRFVSDYGIGTLMHAVQLTRDEYCDGNMTRRMVASKLDVPAIVGIVITQEIEDVVDYL